MGAYILRRVLLMIPTLFGIMAISFAVIQFAPGGPVEQVIAKLTGQGGDAGDRISAAAAAMPAMAAAISTMPAKARRNTAARRASIPNSSPSSKSSSASTSRRSSASA